MKSSLFVELAREVKVNKHEFSLLKLVEVEGLPSHFGLHTPDNRSGGTQRI